MASVGQEVAALRLACILYLLEHVDKTHISPNLPDIWLTSAFTSVPPSVGSTDVVAFPRPRPRPRARLTGLPGVWPAEAPSPLPLSLLSSSSRLRFEEDFFPPFAVPLVVPLQWPLVVECVVFSVVPLTCPFSSAGLARAGRPFFLGGAVVAESVSFFTVLAEVSPFEAVAEAAAFAAAAAVRPSKFTKP